MLTRSILSDNEHFSYDYPAPLSDWDAQSRRGSHCRNGEAKRKALVVRRSTRGVRTKFFAHASLLLAHAATPVDPGDPLPVSALGS
jgi:hypothetical protein